MTLTALPSEIIAGDSYTIQLTYTDYPTADGWTLKLALRGATALNSTATVSGSAYQLTLTPTATSILTEGTYAYAVTVERTDERVTVQDGWMKVKPNLVSLASKVTHAQQMITAIESVLAGKITADISSMAIAGRSLTKIPIPELMKLRVSYYKELRQLQNNSTPQSVMTPIRITFTRD